MKDLLTNGKYHGMAIRKIDYIESRTNKRKEEKSDQLDSSASECRYTVGSSFNY